MQFGRYFYVIPCKFGKNYLYLQPILLNIELMKRILLFFIFLFSVIFSFAQKTISMEKDGGVYKIPCFINGAKMKMVFDTGAAAVSLSMAIANYLFENDFIKKEDIIGKGKSYVANGEIVDHIIINLRDVEIAGLHLRNVKATVIDGQNAPLLLGQSAIQALGSVTIRGNLLIINDAPRSQLSDVEVERLQKEYVDHMKIGSYHAALDCILKIKAARNINIAGYDALSRCYLECERYDECIENCNETLRKFELHNESNLLYKVNAQSYLAESYYYLGQYEQAVSWYEKTMANRGKDFSSVLLIKRNLKNMAMTYGYLGNKEKCKEMFNGLLICDDEGLNMEMSSSEAAKKYKGVEYIQRMAEDFMIIADACAKGFLDYKSSSMYHNALRLQSSYLGYDSQKVIDGKIRGTNHKLGYILYLRGLYADTIEEADMYLRLAVKWGDKNAQEFFMKMRAQGFD